MGKQWCISTDDGWNKTFTEKSEAMNYYNQNKKSVIQVGCLFGEKEDLDGFEKGM